MTINGNATVHAPGNRRRDRALAVGGAVAAAVAVWLVAAPLLGVELRVESAGREPFEIGLGPTVIFSLLPSLAGWALLAVLERFTARARVVWTAVALVVLVLSFVPLADVPDGGAKIALALIHVAVGAVLIPVFWRTAR